MLIFGPFQKFVRELRNVFQTGEGLLCWLWGIFWRRELMDLGANLVMFSQNHWDAVYHKPRLTGVWHCQECPRTDLRTNAGVVSFENLPCTQWFLPDCGLRAWWQVPESVISKAARKMPVWEPWTYVLFPLWGLQARIKIEQESWPGGARPYLACRCVLLISHNAFSKNWK